jgi:hypothetical protein
LNIWTAGQSGRRSSPASGSGRSPTDFRGWLGLALFLQSTFLFCLLAAIPKLNENQGFLTLASAVIVTGWVGGAAAFAYSAGKGAAERSEQISSLLRITEANQPKAPDEAAVAAGKVADAATDKADEIAGEGK